MWPDHPTRVPMRWLPLLVLGLGTAAAQPADSVSTPLPVSGPPRSDSAVERGWWGGAGVAVLDQTGAGQAVVGLSVRLRTPYGVGPVRVEGGAASAVALSAFGSGEVLTEGHVALGADAAVGPVLLAVAAGPSLASVYRAESPDRALVPGLYAGAQVLVVVLPPFGIGVEAYAHVNRERSVVGLGTTLAFGRLPARALVTDPPPRPRPAR